MATDPDWEPFVYENPLLLDAPTIGSLDVEITNPGSVVSVEFLSPGDNHVEIGYLPTHDADAARTLHAALAAAEDANEPTFVIEGNRLTVALPDVPGKAGVQLQLPAGSTVTYSSRSGELTYDGRRNARDNQVTRPDVPMPRLDLTYRADHGRVNVIYAAGSVDVFDRAGSISLHLDGGIGTARTSTGSIWVSGTGTLSIQADEPGSEALLNPPCDLDLTVRPGAGDARYGLYFNSAAPLKSGSYHAAADFPTSQSPESDRPGPPVLRTTPVESTHDEASRTASAVLAGPAGTTQSAGPPATEHTRPLVGGAPGPSSDRDRSGHGRASAS